MIQYFQMNYNYHTKGSYFFKEIQKYGVIAVKKFTYGEIKLFFIQSKLIQMKKLELVNIEFSLECLKLPIYLGLYVQKGLYR